MSVVLCALPLPGLFCSSSSPPFYYGRNQPVIISGIGLPSVEFSNKNKQTERGPAIKAQKQIIFSRECIY